MDINASCPLATELAQRIRAERVALTTHWLERIAARVAIDSNRVFPSEELLDHMPILLEGIADYLEDASDEISAAVPVIAKAMELGSLRLHQGFDAHEILKEYEILGGVLFNFAARAVGAASAPCDAGELLIFSHRLFRAIAVIEQATTSHYLRTVNDRVHEREEQLRRFNRMVSHELKNKVGAVLGAGELIQEEWLSSAERQKFAQIVLQNARALQQMLENLTELSRLDADSRRQRNVLLREAVAEVVRQQRELARTRHVEITVEDLPSVEVNAAAVELCLSNYLSNALKYCNPDASQRWVRISAMLENAGTEAGVCRLVVRVADNGMGVPPEARAHLFERFFRAVDVAAQVDGTGLGLSIVRETVEAMGGKAWAEFQDGVSIFQFALPCRRSGDSNSTQLLEGSGRTRAAGRAVSSTREPGHD